MLIQITMVKNERFLIEQNLPVWKKYADGFVFFDDCSDDGLYDFLIANKEKYNILEVIRGSDRLASNKLSIERDCRQPLYDAAMKYSNKILILDADEYFDGSMTKQELETLMEQYPNTTFQFRWLQYTSENTIRVDGPWKENYKIKAGHYTTPQQLSNAYLHIVQIPQTEKQLHVNSDLLFVSHLQWLSKTHAAIKQYYWKTYDYVLNKKFGIETTPPSAYDASVANFEWEEEYFDYPLKVNADIFAHQNPMASYKWKYIVDKTKQYNIPNLGDWGLNITNMDPNSYVPPNPYKVSVITGIGKLHIYEKFVDRYFQNTTQQYLFKRTEHIIVYSEWSEKFDHIKSQKNFKFIKDNGTGIYNAWNLGIQAATTKYITNWNIDDLRHPINTKIKYDLLEKNPQFDVAYNNYVATNDVNENFYNIDLTKKNVIQFPDQYEKHVMDGCLIGPDPMWKKSLHSTAGYFDNENFPSIGDWDMWIRFARSGAKFKLIPEVLCLYLCHEDTVSNQNVRNGSQNQQHNLLYKKYKL